jgi:hypothetical protein
VTGSILAHRDIKTHPATFTGNWMQKVKNVNLKGLKYE